MARQPQYGHSSAQMPSRSKKNQAYLAWGIRNDIKGIYSFTFNKQLAHMRANLTSIPVKVQLQRNLHVG